MSNKTQRGLMPRKIDPQKIREEAQRLFYEEMSNLCRTNPAEYSFRKMMININYGALGCTPQGNSWLFQDYNNVTS
jgi:hypothetical protein